MGAAEQTQTVKLNKWLRPGAQQAATDATQWYQGQPEYIGMSPERRGILQNISDIAGQGQASQPFMQEYGKVLGGEYLDVASNPYLQDVVNRAVSAAGRGPTSGAMAGNRMQSGAFANALADARTAVAERLYADQYNRERQNMQAMMAMAPMAQQMQFADPLMQAGVQEQFEAEARRERDYPLERINQLQATLGGNPLMGATQTRIATPFDWGGFAAGAAGPLMSLAGGAIGSFFGPPGAMLGASLGGGVGAGASRGGGY